MLDPAALEWPVPRPFLLTWQVGPDDIDDLDHVSNVRFLHWMNLAAKSHSEALGFDVARYREEGGVFVVRRHEIDYLEPALAGEALVVGTWPSGLKRSIAERRHEIRRLRDGKLITRGVNLWVFVDLERGRPMRIPPAVIAAFDPAHWGGSSADR
ncbi:MAG: acyl-CoA thioesterase [Planctomycetes bacterium]|nr:acyl-CoA thioesterase [Planctomycetota bacterium]